MKSEPFLCVTPPHITTGKTGLLDTKLLSEIVAHFCTTHHLLGKSYDYLGLIWKFTSAQNDHYLNTFSSCKRIAPQTREKLYAKKREFFLTLSLGLFLSTKGVTSPENLWNIFSY